MIKLALRPALSDRANEGKIIVIDSWGFDAPSTKSASAALAALGINGSVLIVHGREDINAIKSFRNLPSVQLLEVAELNAYDILCNEIIVFTKDNLPGEVSDVQAPVKAAKKAPAKKAAQADETAETEQS